MTEPAEVSIETPAPEVNLGEEELVSVTPSSLAKLLLIFVGGAACGILIGLTVATLTKPVAPDFVAPPQEPGAFLSGDDLLAGAHEETENQD